MRFSLVRSAVTCKFLTPQPPNHLPERTRNAAPLIFGRYISPEQCGWSPGHLRRCHPPLRTALDSTSTLTHPGNGINAPGVVARLWRYPVKSMLGEPCEYLDVDPRGVAGDRLFAIRDAGGKFWGGKSTRRFRRIDGIFAFHAVYEGGVPAILFPDGRTMRGDHPEIHTALSHTLGQPVTLAREANIPHWDAGPAHLLTTAALAWLWAALPDVPADERRFRPDLVIDVPGATQVERGWLGKTLSVGSAVRLRVSAATERCGMVAFAQKGLPDDARILRCITQEAALHFGVYAEYEPFGVSLMESQERFEEAIDVVLKARTEPGVWSHTV